MSVTESVRLEYRDDAYHLTEERLVGNLSAEPIDRYPMVVTVDRYPGERERSDTHHRQNPLTMDELQLHATCDGRPMHSELTANTPFSKEIWLLLRNDDETFHIPPGGSARIRATVSVGDDKWGPWFHLGIRIPTTRLEIRIALPVARKPELHGSAIGPRIEERALDAEISRETEGDLAVFVFRADAPPLNSRYRFWWNFAASGRPHPRRSRMGTEQALPARSQLAFSIGNVGDLAGRLARSARRNPSRA